MTPEERLVTVREGADDEEVLALLHKHRIEKVLVVGEGMELRGMITAKDFQKATDFPHACKDDRGALRVGAAVGTGYDTDERIAALVGMPAWTCSRRRYLARLLQGRCGTRAARRRNAYPELQVIAGNIVTGEAALALVEAGADAVKVGIGPGSICTTRVSSAACRRTADLGCRRSRRGAEPNRGVPLIADGGIRYSGDIAKAVVAGAHAVMIGGLFAGTEESPGEVELYQGRSYKSYRGMGSVGAMGQKHGSSDRYFQDATEELEKLVPGRHRGSRCIQGERNRDRAPAYGRPAGSDGLYRQPQHVEEMRTRPKFVQITGAGMRESHVHDVTITKEAPNYRSNT